MKVALWAVESTRGQPKLLVLMDFCSASSERGWALIVGPFFFVLVPLGWKSPTNCCCTNSVPQVSGLITRADREVGCQRHLYRLLCTPDFQMNMCAHFMFFKIHTKSPPNPLILSNIHRRRESVTCSTEHFQGLPEKLLVSMKPSEIDMKDDISRLSVGVLVFSFQLAITPPL